MKKSVVLLILLGVAAIAVASSAFTVQEGQQALVLRFGKIIRTVNTAGLYFRTPFAEDVEFMQKRLLTLEISDKAVQAIDGRRFLVATFAMFRIKEPKQFKESVSGNLNTARSRLETRMDAALRRVYGARSFKSALSNERENMMKEIKDAVSTEAATLGLELVDVRIKRTDLLPEVSKSTFDRMKSERQKEAAQFRADGREANLRIKAQADRKATVLVAEAVRTSEIKRGEGDAERNKIFAKAYGQDPEFFDFYRSLKAYENALQSNSTTMVLSPDSDFFRYFGAQTSKSGKDTGAASN